MNSIAFNLEELAANESSEHVAQEIDHVNRVVREFRAEFGDLIDSPLFKASSPIDTITREFPGVLLFNGDVSKKNRRANVTRFQDDESGPQVILMQSAAGKEGISLHDTTGKHQRVLFNLGQPTQPTTAIQQEGRIYRTGQVTDALFRYLNTGTRWEQWAFATTIAQRASTAENLGMGEAARALKDAFINGFEESGDYRAGMEGEGKGGKARDRAANAALTEYDRARAFYFGNQKKNSRTKAQEGADYFATPEPVGLKMVEFADIRPGESVLEPSAGHGAIARWMPENAKRTAIEPSMALRPRLAMVFDGDIVASDFEDLNAVNKYDAIVMNPPFGTGGKLAMEHLGKAVSHLRDGGRIVALLPTGPAADKKFEQWMYGESERAVKPLFEHPALGSIYRGDTVKTRAAWMPDAVLSRQDKEGRLWFKDSTGVFKQETSIDPAGIVSVEPSGKRTELVKTAPHIYMLANLKMPAVTFERADTRVMTRIVVLEKHSDAEKAPSAAVARDYTGVEDIGELFDRLEHASLPERSNARVIEEEAPVSSGKHEKFAKREVTTDALPESGSGKAEGEAASVESVRGDKLLTDAPQVEHITAKGKKIYGVIARELTKDQAKTIDAYTWAKDGGFFIRMAHVVRPGVDDESNGLESRRALTSDDTKLTSLLTQLAEHDNLFQQPAAFADTPEEIGKEIDPNYPVRKLGPSSAREKGVDVMWEIGVPNSKARSGYLYQKGNEVWLDVSRLLPHIDSGNIIYGIAAGYAHNTGRVLIGDPAGLSRLAFFRRTENMISSILKYGTSDHLAPHRAQVDPASFYHEEGHTEFGQSVRAVDWEPGNTAHNLRELLYTSYQGAMKHVPELKNVTYDFGRRTFVRAAPGGAGIPLAGDFFTQLSKRVSTRLDTPYRAGSATLKRAALVNTLVRGQTAEAWGHSVAEARRQLRGDGLDPDLEETFYSKADPARTEQATPQTPPTGGVSVSGGAKLKLSILRATVDRFGKQFKGAAALDIRVVSSRTEIPLRYRPSPYAEGVYHDTEGLVYLVADNLPDAQRTWQVLMHEAVGHYGLAHLMGGKFASLQAMVLAKGGATRALDRSPMPGDADYATVDAVRLLYPEASDSEIAQEVLARMAETMQPPNWFKVALARVRVWLRAMAEAARLKWEPTLQDARDLVTLAAKHLQAGRNLPRTDSAGEVPAMASMKAGGMESRTHIAGDSGKTYTAEQRATFAKIGRTVTKPTLKERLQAIKGDLGKKMVQGIADQFAPLKNLDGNAYLLARMSRGTDGALEAMLKYGKVKLTDGIYDVDAKDGGVIDKLLKPLGKEMDDFMWWVAGNRAEQLKAAGKENLMASEDIAALKALGQGTLDFDYTLLGGAKTRSRAMAFRAANGVLQQFNQSVMDIAEHAGLIDGEDRAVWERDFYVPFYRQMEEGRAFPSVKSGLVRQQAFKALKGGADALNHDLLANTLLNWSHILNAAAKNRAARAAMAAAVDAGIAEQVPAASKGTVAVRENGQERHYRVDDPFVMDAITALEFSGFSGPAMQALTKFKNFLTIGVTANPAFKIRNLIRDSISAVGQAELSYNVLDNLKKGYAATDRESQTYASMLASGGIIRFGTMIEGNRASHVRRLVEKGVSADTILDGESKLRAFFNRRIAPAVEAYNELGDRGESVNRAALYERLRERGMSHAEASFAARDLLDFSMGGTWAAVRFLMQTVPFTNARIQGLYKLGRAAKENPKRFGYVVGAVALASLALLGAYGDDDDWKKREDWDRDNYWWFKVGGVAYRIPKPFEIGAIGTLAERSAELLTDKEMDGRRFGERIKEMALNTFALNPVPQLFKPLVDLYSNRDSFTGRPIESMGMERLRAEDRYTARSSEVAKLAGKAVGVSPVQIDHLIRGYFSWLGTAATTSVDSLVRLADDKVRPAATLRDMFLVGNFVENLPSASSRYVSRMYEQAREVEEAYNSWKHYQKTGGFEKARETLAAEREKIAKYRRVEAVKRAETGLNEQARRVESSTTLTAQEKREALDRIAAQKDRVARSIAAGA